MSILIIGGDRDRVLVERDVLDELSLDLLASMNLFTDGDGVEVARD